MKYIIDEDLKNYIQQIFEFVTFDGFKKADMRVFLQISQRFSELEPIKEEEKE